MEKFALLNLLNALNTLAAKPAGKQAGANGNTDGGFTETSAADNPNFTPPPPSPNASAPAGNPPIQAEPNTYPNVMASVLERHEAISNRVKNKK